MAIIIVEHRPSWQGETTVLIERLRARLGPLALRLDPIGSTAVPGLCAKDVLDLQLTVPGLTRDVEAALADLGFRRNVACTRDHRPPGEEGPDTDWEKWLFHPAAGRPVNLHVRVTGRPNQLYPLLFRDYLRNHPHMARAYGELKRRLADTLRDPDDYPDVKDPAVDLIWLAARAWARATGWSPGSGAPSLRRPGTVRGFPDLRFVPIEGEFRPLAEWLSAETWPFHSQPRPRVGDVLARAAEGYYHAPDVRSFRVLGADVTPLAFLRLFDLGDITPLLDIRVRQHQRGNGIGRVALAWATDHVFSTCPEAVRFGGYTRHDNASMCRVFQACGFTAEARHREAWPREDGPPLDTLGWFVLRREWCGAQRVQGG